MAAEKSFTILAPCLPPPTGRFISNVRQTAFRQIRTVCLSDVYIRETHRERGREREREREWEATAANDLCVRKAEDGEWADWSIRPCLVPRETSSQWGETTVSFVLRSPHSEMLERQLEARNVSLKKKKSDHKEGFLLWFCFFFCQWPGWNWVSCCWWAWPYWRAALQNSLTSTAEQWWVWERRIRHFSKTLTCPVTRFILLLFFLILNNIFVQRNKW